MRTLRVPLVVVVATLLLGQQISAQSLRISLFERYLDSLREQAGIPGLSAAVLQDGAIVWERGFGKQDLDANIAASPDTPYPIGGLSQAFAATALLEKCVDESYLEVTDRVVQWVPAYRQRSTTIAQLLTHTSPAGSFRYDPLRFAGLTPVFDQCANAPYRTVLTRDVLERFAMIDTVPGQTLGSPTAADRQTFSAAQLARYAAVLGRLAVPYRIDSRGRPNRAEYVPQPVDAATGIVTTVRDLARFDAALRTGALLRPATLRLAWTRVVSNGMPLPTGLGWFVQDYNGEPLVWQFGLEKDAYSSLFITVPNRGLTLILLANSDGLGAPASLQAGDVTSSIFATLFLRVFVG